MRIPIILFFFSSILFSCSKTPGPPQVSVASVKYVVSKQASGFPGHVSFSETAEIRPFMEGVISEIYFKEGSYVHKGDKLFLMSPIRHQAKLNHAEAELKLAMLKLESQRLLVKGSKVRLSSRSRDTEGPPEMMKKLQAARARVKRAQAQLLLSQNNVDQTVFYSPISGQLGRVKMTVGEFIRLDRPEPLAVVRSLDPVYVDFRIPKGSKIFLSDEIQVRIELGKNRETYPYDGRIKGRSVENSEIIVRSLVPNPEHLLLAGMTVMAQLDLPQTLTQKKLTIPEGAILPDAHGVARVWVLRPDLSVELRALESLRENDVVVTDHLLTLKNGEKVMPNNIQAEEE
jgi:membrane fusion protein, multidrug efflux system